jgi:hypothetical protein
VQLTRGLFLFLLLFRANVVAASSNQLHVGLMIRTNSERRAPLENFLKQHFDKVTLFQRGASNLHQLQPVDVLVLDWPQNEEGEKLQEITSPLGPREKWGKPTVLLGSAGLHIAKVWDVLGGFG